MKGAQALKKCPAFSGLSDTHLDRLAAIAEEKEYSAGTTIFQEGSDAGEFLIVEDGKVALQMTMPKGSEKPARKVTVDIINSNEVIDWSAIVEPFILDLAAVCLQKTKILGINAINLRLLLKHDPQINQELTMGLVKDITDRLAVARQVLVSERL